MPRNPPLSHNLGMVPPSPDRRPVFPVLPPLFGVRGGIQTKPLIDRSHIVPHIGMYGNDVRSNCSSVAIANGINAISALLYPDDPSKRPIINTNNALYFYSESTGFDPSVPSSDKGANPDSVAEFVQKHGYPTQSEYLFPLVGEIDLTDLQSLRSGLDAYGVLNLGVGLSISDRSNEVWDVGTTPDYKMGSWGYHLLNLWDYDGLGDTDLVTLLTFERKQKATWNWIRERCMLAYGHAYIQLTTPKGDSFDNVAWNRFITTCEQCSKNLDT